MGALDLTTVFSIAIETVEGVREYHGGCGEWTEMVVMYANGRGSDVQRMRQDTRKRQKLALLANPSSA